MKASRPDPLAIETSGPVDATVSLPGSKSITNRAVVCAALARGGSTIHGALAADDTEAMLEALRAAGASIDADDAGTLHFSGGGLSGDSVTVDARQSGTTARFLIPALATDDVERTVDGDEQLRNRPMGPSLDAVRALGATVRPPSAGAPDDPLLGSLPASVCGPMRGGRLDVDGDVSSQFLSGLLLAAPSMAEGLTVRVATELISRPYVDMTVAVMAAFGAQVSVEGDDTWVVAPRPYAGSTYAIEPDASAASYAWALALVTGGSVTVPGLGRRALQGDVAVADVFAQMGARVRWDDDAVTVAAGDTLRGVDVDMAHISDTVPTVAVVAAGADGPTRIRNVGFIRHKESDRIAGTVAELRRLGVDADETDDGLVIRPAPGPFRPAVVETYRDHRMAMAFALAGLRSPGIAIADPGCVAKTFPGYWDLVDAVRAHAVPSARAV